MTKLGSIYVAELERLRERVLFMSATVEEMVEGSVRAFLKRDSKLASRLRARDDEIDSLESEIDQRCVRLFARRQPVACDLRFVATVFKLVTHLERIGDLGEGICERVVELSEYPAQPVARSLIRMSGMAPDMLHQAMDAFANRDTVKARVVMQRDAELDQLYAQTFPELTADLSRSRESIEWATRLQSVGKGLERIGDEATNISELVVFMVEGSHVRRHHREQISDERRLRVGNG